MFAVPPRLLALAAVASLAWCSSVSGANEQEGLEAFQREIGAIRQSCCLGVTTYGAYMRRYVRAYRDLADKHGIKLDLFFDAQEAYVTRLGDRLDRGGFTWADAQTADVEFRVKLLQERNRFQDDIRRRLGDAAELKAAELQHAALVIDQAVEQERRRLYDLVEREDDRLQQALREKALELERRRLREAANRKLERRRWS